MAEWVEKQKQKTTKKLSLLWRKIKVAKIYEKYMETNIWKVLDRAFSDLVENQDIEERTDRNYLIGYLIKCLEENSCVKIE